MRKSVKSSGMKRVCGVLIFIAALCVSGSPAFAQAAVSDTVCPAAVSPLKALAAVNSTNDPVKIADAARNVVRAYNDCISSARTDGAVEPQMHYDQVRAAQYGVLLGRVLYLQQNYDGAHAAFVDARRLSGEVVDWTPASMGYNMNNKLGSGTSRNTGVNKSQWHDSAADIVKASDAELAKLVPASPAP
jgi:hypothetical protein